MVAVGCKADFYLFDYPQIAPQVHAANELLIETGYYGNVPGYDPFYCNPINPYHPNVWSMAFADAIAAYETTFGIPDPGTNFVFGSAPAVPEPATWALLLVGFAGQRWSLLIRGTPTVLVRQC